MKTAIVTCYYNPSGYKTRTINYHLFRNQLPAPLLTVYLDYDNANELTAADADMFFRLQGSRDKNVLWQKETLMNIGARNLPKEVENVIFLDADLIISDSDWLLKIEQALEQCKVLQPFSECVRLPQHAVVDEYRTKALPFGYDVDEIQPSRLNRQSVLGPEGNTVSGHPGFGVAVKRELLSEVGLYEHCVLGSGDTVLINSSLGRSMRYPFLTSPLHFVHFDSWHKAWSRSVAGKTGVIEDSRILHLWHGTRANRQYTARYPEVFKGYRFNPRTDIAKHENGLLSWVGDPAIYVKIRNYFDSRKEDG